MELRSIVLLITFGPVSIQDSIHCCWVMFRLGRLASFSQSQGENLTSHQSQPGWEAEMNAGECYADHYHSRFQDSFTLFVTRWELLETETSQYTWSFMDCVLGPSYSIIKFLWSNHLMWSVMDGPYQTDHVKHNCQCCISCSLVLAPLGWPPHTGLITIDDAVIGLKHWQPQIQMGELSRGIRTISDSNNNNHSSEYVHPQQPDNRNYKRIFIECLQQKYKNTIF